MSDKRAVIVYSGLAAANAPRIEVVRDGLVRDGYVVRIIAFCKTATPGGAAGSVFAFGNARGRVAARMRFLAALFKFVVAVAASKSDVLYAVNPIAGMASLFAVRRRWVTYESQEIFVGMSGRHSVGWRRFVWFGMERIVFATADAIVFPDEFRLKFARRLFRLKGKRLVAMYNVSSQASVAVQAAAGQRRGQISYCGGLQRARGILNIIRAFAISDARRSGLTLVLAGGGSEEFISEVRQTIREHHLEGSVIITGPLTNSELLTEMALSLITVALYERDSVNNRLCSPNKLFDAIATRVVLIATSAPLTRKMAKAGYPIVVVDEVDDLTLAKAMTEAVTRVEVRHDLPVFSPETEWRRAAAVVCGCMDYFRGEHSGVVGPESEVARVDTSMSDSRGEGAAHGKWAAR